jgi:hypothetical protein
MKVRYDGLVLYTRNSANRLVAVLREIGSIAFDHRKLVPPQYPGGCQVTCFGRHEMGVVRVAEYQLGPGPAIVVLHNEHNLQVLHTHDDAEESFWTFGLYLPNPEEVLPDIQMESSSGQLRLVDAQQAERIRDLEQFDITEGVTDRRIIALSKDEIIAVRKGFELFGS